MANRYWVASTDGTFSSSSNWSISSGGSSGASVPDATTVAIFDSNGVGRCILTSNIEILDLVVSSGYTGSMVQGSSIMSMRDATFAGGSFSGGSGSIIVSNALNLTGADFTSTSGSLYVYKNFNCSSAVSKFHHNDGTVVSYAHDKRFDPNGINFNSLIFARDSTIYDHQFVDSTCTVSRNLVLNGGYLRTGYDSTIIAYGNIYCNAGFGRLDNEHDALIHLMGLNTQLFYANGGVYPNLYVDKSTTNQVKAFGDYPIYINGDFIIFDGTFNTNGHDIIQGNLDSVPSPSVYVVDFTWGLYPGTPSDLTAFTVSSTEVGLTWTDTATDETGFKVERSLDGTVFSQIATVIADSTNYDDTGLSGGTQYWYRVRSYNGVGDSPYSNIDDATTEITVGLDFGWDSSSDSSYSDYRYFLSSKEPVRFIDRSIGTYTTRDWTFGYDEPITSMWAITPGPTGNYILGSGVSAPSQVIYSGIGTTDWSLASLPFLADTNSRLVYANGLFVLCDGSVIKSSSDFVNWTQRLSVVESYVRSITWGNNEFLGVGVSQSPVSNATYTVRSADGTNWSYKLDTTANYKAFTTSSGIFWDTTNYYTGSSSYGIVRSVDGSSWSQVYNTTKDVLDGAHGNGLYLFVGRDTYVSYSWLSSDGSSGSWTQRNIDPIGTIDSIVYADGTFVGLLKNSISASSYKRLFKSYNGLDWTGYNLGDLGTIYTSDIAYGPTNAVDKKYVAVGYSMSTGYGTIYSSLDASNWTLRHSIDTTRVKEVVCNSDRFVAVGGLNTTGRISTSSDGTSWLDQTNTTYLNCVTWSEDLDLFVAAGTEILTSSDGSTWTTRAPSVTVLPARLPYSSVAYGAGRFILSGANQLMLTSVDGTDWTSTSHSAFGTDPVQVVRFENNKFYASSGVTGGATPRNWVSNNGLDWTRVGPYELMGDYAYGNGIVVTGGQEGFTYTPLLYSIPADGTWTLRSDTCLMGKVKNVVFGNNRFVASTGYDTRIGVTTNGIDWDIVNIPIAHDYLGNYPQFNDLIWDGTSFVVCGSGAFIGQGTADKNLTSYNGYDWTAVPVFPAVSSSEYPYVTFPSTGDYTVALIRTNDASEVLSISKTITVITLNAGFYWDSSSGGHTNQNPFDATYQPISFDSNYNVGDHTWGFGDGTYAYTNDALHSYVIPLYDTSHLKNYKVDHTVSYLSNVVTYSLSLDITSASVANFSWTTDTSDTKKINFTDISLYNPTSWDWTFGDGSYSTSQNPSNTYSDYTTSYTVTLRSNTSAGLDSITKTVTTGRTGGVTFTRPDYSPDTSDSISSALKISRKNTQGIYNSVTESGYTHNSSPSDTEWSGIYGSIVGDYTSLSYTNWESAIGAEPPDMVGNIIYMHIVSEDRYFEMHFTAWSENNTGGGLSYTRYELT